MIRLSDARQRPDPGRILSGVLAVFCATKLAILGLAAIHCRYVMDEYDQMSFSLLVQKGLYWGLHDIKTALYIYYFGIGRLFTSNSVSLMRLGRIEALLLGFGIVFLTYWSARRLQFGRLESWFGVSALLSVSIFMERSFEIRSDTVAVFFATLLLYWSTRARFGSPIWSLGIGLLGSLAFLSTQKAVYVVLAVGVGLAVACGRRFILNAILAGAGFWSGILVYSFVFFGRELPGRIREMFLLPAQAPSLHGGALYPDIRRFVWSALERNPAPYAVMAAGVALSLAAWGRLGREERFALAFSSTIAIAYFAHSQPWPYVLLWPLPFLAIWAPVLVRYLAKAFSAPGEFVMLVLLAVFAISFRRNIQRLELTNDAQEETTAVAERLLAPQDRYVDGVWMVPTRLQAGLGWLDANGIQQVRLALNQGDSSPIDDAFHAEPKVWILNYRIAALWRALGPRLQRSYVPVFPNVLLSGAEVSEASAEFDNAWPGRYSLYTNRGEILQQPFWLDGQEVRPPLALSRGSHRIAIPSGALGRRVFLLPEGSSIPGPLPAPIWGPDLFAGVYE